MENVIHISTCKSLKDGPHQTDNCTSIKTIRQTAKVVGLIPDRAWGVLDTTFGDKVYQ